MNEEKVKVIAVAIAQALGLKKLEDVQQVLSNMSQEGIQAVAQVVESDKDDKTKLTTIQNIVKQDLQNSQVQQARYGAKLNYIKRLNLA